MKTVYLPFLLLSVGLLACGGNRTLDNVSENSANGRETKSGLEELSQAKIQNSAKIAENKDFDKNLRLAPEENRVEELLKDKSVHVEFAPFDKEVIKTDTSFIVNGEKFEVRCISKCLNDQNVVQELYVIDKNKGGKKTFLITHNYQTDVAISRSGQLIAEKTIKKELFSEQLEGDFLNKSILKLSQTPAFNSQQNELNMVFFIGVPNSDYLVSAKVSIDAIGQFKIKSLESANDHF